MNVERLHSLLLGVIEDIEESNTARLLADLRDWTQRLSNNPQDVNAQREFSLRRSQLMEALNAANSNSYSPGTVSDLDSLGISRLLGAVLALRLETVFGQNEFTLAVVSDQIAGIEEELTKLIDSLRATVAAFEVFGIASEDPGPGEVEARVILPRSSIDNSLQSLGTEFRQLERLFSDITELATGSRPPTIVRSIAASDFSVYVQYLPEAAVLLAIALDKTVALYKNLLEIRRIRSEASSQGISDESLGGIDEHISSHMDQGLDKVVDEVFEEVQIEVSNRSRRNELKTSLKLTLTNVAARIDRGYRFDIRIGDPIEIDDDEADEREAKSSYVTATKIIAERREGLQFLQLEGDSILQLPSPDVNDE